MSILRIKTDRSESWFKPGSSLDGEGSWHLDADAEAVEIRLFWFTQGKGTQDVVVVDREVIDRPEPSGHRRFRFDVPNGPYCFSGRLITVKWALELVVLPGDETERVDLLVGPRPIEISVSHLREW